MEKALIAYAGIDAPPYQSGQFTGTQRKISKRGSASLRKIGYEVMWCLKTHKSSKEDAVYEFILKKERE
ncbi:transposase [Lacrimispora sp.]|uniref:transposase n=1 Tax=Lacrimispora sp. TaxID=2719234 RepID=UPI00345F2C00